MDEKNRAICVIIEGVCKQYNLLVKYGTINYEFHQVNSDLVAYEDIPSMVENKYAYLLSDRIQYIVHLLFDKQSVLANYTDDEIIPFFESIKGGGLNVNELKCLDSRVLNVVVEEAIIYIDEHGVIKVDDLELMQVLQNFFDGDLIATKHYTGKWEEKIEKLKNENHISLASTLLSTGEASLFNYYLNARQYVDGPDIRNKYGHGNMQVNDDEKESESYYYTLLRLLILLIIKINDDLCVWDIERSSAGD